MSDALPVALVQVGAAPPSVRLRRQSTAVELETLSEWLLCCGLKQNQAEKYAEMLTEEGFENISRLRAMTDEDLRDVGSRGSSFKKGHLKLIRAQIAADLMLARSTERRAHLKKGKERSS